MCINICFFPHSANKVELNDSRYEFSYMSWLDDACLQETPKTPRS